MKTTALWHLSLCVLFVLLVGNIFLFGWFASRARQSSTDEIIQKAYIVSRLLSESAAKPIVKEDLSALESAVEEALKDRHLVSVMIFDKRGKLLLENTAIDPPAKLSTFETPIKVGQKNLGRVVTSFSVAADSERLAASLRHVAALQGGLYALVAGLLLAFCVRESRRAPSGGPGGRSTGASGTAAGDLMTVAVGNGLTGHSLPDPRLLPWVPISSCTPSRGESCDPDTVSGAGEEDEYLLHLPELAVADPADEPLAQPAWQWRNGGWVPVAAADTGAPRDLSPMDPDSLTVPVIAAESYMPFPSGLTGPVLAPALRQEALSAVSRQVAPGAHAAAVAPSVKQSPLRLLPWYSPLPRTGSPPGAGLSAAMPPLAQKTAINLPLPSFKAPAQLAWLSRNSDPVDPPVVALQPTAAPLPATPGGVHSLLAALIESALARFSPETGFPAQQTGLATPLETQAAPVPQETLAPAAESVRQEQDALSVNLYRACTALQEALAVLSAEAEHRQAAGVHAGLCRARITVLQQEAADGAGHAETLLATSGDIISLVKEQCLSLAGSGASHVDDIQLLGRQLQDSLHLVCNAMEGVDRIGAKVRQVEVLKADFGEGSIMAAAEIARAGASMREEALPAVAAALRAEDAVAGHAASLSRLMEEFDGRSGGFTRSSVELSRMALSLRRSTDFFADPADRDDADAWLDLLAGRMADLAERVEREAGMLRAMVSEAVAVGRTLALDASHAKENLAQAGRAVEDAVAVSTMGGELLWRLAQEMGGGKDTSDGTARVAAELAPELQDVRRPLAEHLQIMGRMAGDAAALGDTALQQQLRAHDCAASLPVASEALHLARLFLAQSLAGTTHLAETSRETSPLPGEVRQVEASHTLGQLIGEAQERLALVMKAYER